MPEELDTPYFFLPEPGRVRTPEQLVDDLAQWTTGDMRLRLTHAADAVPPAPATPSRWTRVRHALVPGNATIERALSHSLHAQRALLANLGSMGDTVRTANFLLLAGWLPGAADEGSRHAIRSAMLTGLLPPALLGDQTARTALQQTGFSMPDLAQRYYTAYAALRSGSNAAEVDVRARAAGQVVRDVLTGRTSAQPQSAMAQLQRPAGRDRQRAAGRDAASAEPPKRTGP